MGSQRRCWLQGPSLIEYETEEGKALGEDRCTQKTTSWVTTVEAALHRRAGHLQGKSRFVPSEGQKSLDLPEQS